MLTSHTIYLRIRQIGQCFPVQCNFLFPLNITYFKAHRLQVHVLSFSMYLYLRKKIPSTFKFLKNFDSSALILNTQAIAQRGPFRIHACYWYVPGKCSVCHFSNKSIKKPGLSVIEYSLWNIDLSRAFNQPWPKPTANLVS